MSPIHVAENFFERFALLRCVFRKSCTNCAGLLVRRNVQLFDVFTKICNPVRQFVELFAKFLRWCVAYLS